MKNKLLAICFLCLPAYFIIAQEDTEDTAEKTPEVIVYDEETQQLVEEFYLPYHEKMARKKAREQAKQAETQAIDEEGALTESEIPNNTDLDTVMVEETSESTPPASEEDDINYCSLINNNRDNLWTEFYVKQTILTVVDEFIDANRATGRLKLSPEQQRNYAIPAAIGAWGGIHYIVKPLAKITIHNLPLLNSKSMRSHVNQYKNNIQLLSKLKGELKQIENTVKQTQKEVKTTTKKLEQITKEQKKYWAERHQTRNYGLHKAELNTLDEEAPKVNKQLKNLKSIVSENSDKIPVQTSNIESVKTDIQLLRKQKPFLFRTRNFMKGTLLTGVALIGFGAYAAIAGETVVLLFEGLEELQKIHNQFTVDTLIISDCLGIDEDILDVILNN